MSGLRSSILLDARSEREMGPEGGRGGGGSFFAEMCFPREKMRERDFPRRGMSARRGAPPIMLAAVTAINRLPDTACAQGRRHEVLIGGGDS